MSEWIKIEDKKPPNNIYVLIAKYDGRPKVKMFFISIASRINDAWINDHNGELMESKYGSVTHWMPLPDVPKE